MRRKTASSKFGLIGQPDDSVLYASASLVGDLLLVADEHRLLRSSYLDSKLVPKIAQEWICDSTQQVLAKAISQLNQYFEKKRSQFTVPLQMQGTEFQQKVDQLVQEVPLGDITS